MLYNNIYYNDMKIKELDDKIIIYLRDYFFIDNLKEITIEIKDLFNRLFNYYHIELSGLYEVIIFDNIKYGSIIEIIKKEDLFNKNIIDVKVKLFKNNNFYFKTKDYFIISKYNNIYYDNSYYYININNIDNLNKVIEFGNIIYNKKDNYLINKKLIK